MGRWLRLLRRLLPRLLWLLLRPWLLLRRSLCQGCRRGGGERPEAVQRDLVCKSPRRQRARKCGEIQRRLVSWLRLPLLRQLRLVLLRARWCLLQKLVDLLQLRRQVLTKLQVWLQMLKLLRLQRSLPPYLLLKLGMSRL